MTQHVEVQRGSLVVRCFADRVELEGASGSLVLSVEDGRWVQAVALPAVLPRVDVLRG